MNNKVGIILTSIERPQALKKSVESIIAHWQENWVLFVGLQDIYDGKSFSIIKKIIADNPDKNIRLYDLSYDCGISKARNELIQKVNLWGIPYTLLTADSITFDESMKDINRFLPFSFDIIGLGLQNRIKWEAKLNLIEGQCFELDFIEPSGDRETIAVQCDIVRNFWIAKTESLIKVPYDEQLVACEHEDFFWRAKQQGLIVGCTNLCSGTYNKELNTSKYDKIRSTNFRIGMQRLKDKYSLKSWVTYKHLERTKI